jgi:hypothetical protein
MTRPIEPMRWKLAPDDAPNGVADALQAFAAERGDASERARLSERLAALLATPARACTPAGKFGSGRITRWVGWIASLALLTLVALQQRHSTPIAVRAPLAAARATPAAQPSLPALRVAPNASHSAPGLPSLSTTPAPATHSRGHSPPTAAKRERSPERELELLRRAQEALNRTPSAAQAYLDEHARDYPHGAFVQEREMLSIELAVLQSDRAHARELARGFVARYPGSTYQTRLAALLVQDPRPFEQEFAPQVHTQGMDPNRGDHHATGNSR